MAKIIDLATFEFDESKLVNSIATVQKSLLELKAKVADNNKEYKANQQSINLLIASQNALSLSGNKNTEAYKANEKSLLDLNNSQTKLLQNNVVLTNNISGLNGNLKEQQTALSGLSQTASGTETPYKNLNAEMNKMKVEAKNLGAELIILEREGKKGTAEYTALELKFKETSASAAKLDKEFKALDGTVGDNQRNVGDYKNQIKDAFAEINIFNGGIGGFIQRSNEAGGAGNLLKNSFSGIKEGLMGVGKYLLTNPLDILLTVFSGIAAGVREVYQYNMAIKESVILTEQLTGKTGTSADAIRVNTQAFTNTFGGEFKENLRTADELVNDFGISYDEAFKIMTDATIRGANANGEFGESINEYGVFFKKAGFSAQEFANVIGSGVDLGVYSDKLPDAIKEIDLSLREQTKTTKEALVGAFGATFTNDILERVNSGATTTKDALAEISKEAEKSNLTQVQLATLTADVARGAGEDVGGIAVVFKAMNQAINSNKKPLTDLQKATLEVANANRDLELAKDKALKSDAVIAMGQEFSNAWKSIKIGFYNVLANAREFFLYLQNGEIKVRAAFDGIVNILPNIFKQTFATIKQTFNGLVESFILGGSVIGKALSGDFDGASVSFGKFKQSFKDIGSDIKSSASNIASQVSTTISKSNADVDKLLKSKQDKLLAQAKFEDDLVNKEKNKGTSPEQVKANEDSRKKALKEAQQKAKDKENAMKQELEAAIKNAQDLANVQIETAKLSLASYLIDNQSKLTDAKRLTQDLINEENKRLDAVLEKNRDILTAETRTKNEILDAEIKAVNVKDGISESEKLKLAELNLQKTNLTTEYLLKDKEFVQNNDKAKAENTKRYDAQIAEEKKIQQAQGFQLLLNEMEIQGANEYQLKSIQLDNETQLELQKFLESQDLKFQAKIQSQSEQDSILDEIELAKTALNDELLLATDEKEKARIQSQLDAITLIEQGASNKKKLITDEEIKTKLNAYSRLFGDIAGFFGKETAIAKIAGTAQAGINTYLGATAVLADEKVPTFLKPVFVATTIASGLASIAKINGIQGFADGGIITDGQPIQRANGDDVLITAKRGEVVLNQNQQSMLGGARTFASIGVPGFATGGIVGSNLQSVQNNFTQQLDMTAMAELIGQKVYEGSNVGTQSGSQKGIIGLSENRVVANNANF